MGVANRKIGAIDRHWIIKRRSFTEAPIVDIAPDVIGRNGTDEVGFLLRQAEAAEMRAKGDSHVLENAVLWVPFFGIDHKTWVIINFMLGTVRVCEWSPTVAVEGCRPVGAAISLKFIDCDDLARLRVFDQVVVLKAPVRRDVRTECLALVLGISARAGVHVQNPNFKDVTFLGAANNDRAGHDVHAFAAACAIGGIHRASTAAVDVFLILGPVKNALGAWVSVDHSFWVVASLVGQTFYRGVIPGV